MRGGTQEHIPAETSLLAHSGSVQQQSEVDVAEPGHVEAEPGHVEHESTLREMEYCASCHHWVNLLASRNIIKILTEGSEQHLGHLRATKDAQLWRRLVAWIKLSENS